MERAQLSFANKQPPKKKRKSRTAFTNHQIFELEKRFLYQKYLSPADRDEIAATLGLSNAQVNILSTLSLLKVYSIICPCDNLWQLWRVRWRVWHSQCVCHTQIHLASSLQDSSHNYPVTGPCHTPDTPSLSLKWSPPQTSLVEL